MKLNLKHSFFIALGGILLVAILLMNKSATKSKIVTLNQSELKTKVVTSESAKDTGIIRKDINEKRFTGYLLEIKDPKRIKVGYSKQLGREGETTSNIAKDNKAIAAINGGLFEDKLGAVPYNIIMSEGKLLSNDSSGKDSVVGLTKEGNLIVGNHSTEELKELEVTEAISSISTCIINGVGQISSDSQGGVNPRTAIGQKKDGTILLLVIDGRQIDKVGATLKEVQDIMLENGAVSAANLDGGSSSTMYYNGAVLNKPCNASGERKIASIVYVTP